MDENTLDRNIIERYGYAYGEAEMHFEVEPVSASDRKQRKIRKWICKNYPVYEDFTFISKKTSDIEVLSFLKSLFEESQSPEFHEQRFFTVAVDGLSKEVRDCFEELWKFQGMYNMPQKDGNNLRFNLSSAFSYVTEMILEDCEEVSFGNSDFIDFSGSTLSFSDGAYILPALMGNMDEDISYPVVFRFKNVRVERRAFNAIKHAFQSDNPWAFLSYVAFEIIGKASRLEQLVNEKEIDLIPLLSELCLLTYVYSVINYAGQAEVVGAFSCDKITGMPILKGYCDKYGLKKQKVLVEKLEKKLSEDKDPGRLCKKLCDCLKDSACEPAWREIYNLIAESQKEYPRFTDYVVKPEDLVCCREKIQAVMQENGFSGEYPDFYKTVDIKSPRTALCDGEPFVIWFEKNVKLLIHCEEQGYLGNGLKIDFLTVAVRDKKGVNIPDIFSCFFHRRGSVFTNCVCWDNYSYESEVTVDEVARIACKKAELKRLTKKEKQKSGQIALPIGLFALMGVAFGVFFCLGMAIFCFVLCAFLEDVHQAWDITISAPWWQMFLFSGGAFGILMYIAVARAS